MMQQPNAAEGSALAPQVVEHLAQTIVELGGRVPAILLLETLRPLSFVGSQLLLAIAPLAGSGNAIHMALHRYALLLEDRRNVDALLHCLETCRQAPPGMTASPVDARPDEEKA